MPSESDSVEPGHVHLVLLYQEGPFFYLQIPLNIIDSLCRKPRKYLIFLGWCILGVDGKLTLAPGSNEIGTDGALDDQGIYYYSPNEAIGKFSLLSGFPVGIQTTHKVLC